MAYTKCQPNAPIGHSGYDLFAKPNSLAHRRFPASKPRSKRLMQFHWRIKVWTPATPQHRPWPRSRLMQKYQIETMAMEVACNRFGRPIHASRVEDRKRRSKAVLATSCFHGPDLEMPEASKPRDTVFGIEHQASFHGRIGFRLTRFVWRNRLRCSWWSRKSDRSHPESFAPNVVRAIAGR